MTNTIKIDDELIQTTDHLIAELNDNLDTMKAPHIGLNNNAINRSVDFVEFNNWLKEADPIDINNLIDIFGLAPAAIAISGIDVVHTSLLQEEGSIDLSGIIRYVDMAFIRITGGKTLDILRIGQTILGPSFQFRKQREMRAEFAKGFISRYINQRPGVEYPYVIANLMLLSEDEPA